MDNYKNNELDLHDFKALLASVNLKDMDSTSAGCESKDGNTETVSGPSSPDAVLQEDSKIVKNFFGNNITMAERTTPVDCLSISTTNMLTNRTKLYQTTCVLKDRRYADLVQFHDKLLIDYRCLLSNLRDGKSTDSYKILDPKVNLTSDTYEIYERKLNSWKNRLGPQNSEWKKDEYLQRYDDKRYKRKNTNLLFSLALLGHDNAVVEEKVKLDPNVFKLSPNTSDLKKSLEQILDIEDSADIWTLGKSDFDVLVPFSAIFLEDVLETIQKVSTVYNNQLNDKNKIKIEHAEVRTQRGRFKDQIEKHKQSTEQYIGQIAAIRDEQIKEGNQDTVCTEMINRLEILEKVLREEESEQRRIHNQVQELFGNIRVLCRPRPDPSPYIDVNTHEQSVTLVVGAAKHKAKPTVEMKHSFDRVFPMSATQAQVFEAVTPLITSCADGYNVCIMAYGQTGSGKTYTMMGPSHDRGVNIRAIDELFSVLGNRTQWRYSITFSMVEIYNDNIRDLLNVNQDPRMCSVKILTKSSGEFVYQNLSEKSVKTREEVLQFVTAGEKNRTTGRTDLNLESSRSHCLMLVVLKGVHAIHMSEVSSTLTMCDLAGSECLSKSGVKGKAAVETTMINKSLLSLKMAFDSLRKGNKPSYRESKLTYMLRPSLGGDGKCLLFVNVRSDQTNAEETNNTLSFGVQAMQVTPEQAHRRANKMQEFAEDD